MKDAIKISALLGLIILLAGGMSTFAQLPSSGSLSIKGAAGVGRSISQQVDGNETGNKSLTTLSTSAGKTAPHSMLEFYGYPSATNNNFFVGAVSAYDGTLQLRYSTDDASYTDFGSTFNTTACDFRASLNLSPSVTTIYVKLFSSVLNDYISFMFNTVTTSGETCSDSEALVTTATFSNASGSRYMYVHDPPQLSPPGTPENVQAVDQGTGIDVGWAQPLTGGAVDYYIIERNEDSAGWQPFDQTTAFSTQDQTAITASLYVYRVAAHNAAGTSDFVETNQVLKN